MKFGSITTGIIADGLVFNMDAANRASTIPSTNTTTTFNTVDLSQSGSIVTDATWEDGSPPSFDFDGSDARIQTSGFSLAGFPSVTVSHWINRSGANNPTGRIFYESTNTLNYLRLATNLDTNSKAGVEMRLDNTGTNYYITGTTTLTQGSWYLITVIYDGNTSEYKLYVNTTSEGSVLGGTPSGNFSSNASNNLPMLGAGISAGSLSNYLNAKIGSIHIYNRALSASEVLHNYNALKGRFI